MVDEGVVNVFLCDALRCGLLGQDVYNCPADDETLAKTYELAVSHKVCALVYRSAHSSEGFASAHESIREAFRHSALKSVSAQVQRSDEFLRAYALLRRAGITPLVLKGCICRRLYPEPDLRPSADEDLLVSQRELPLCHEILTAHGYTPCTDGDVRSLREVGYYSPGRILKLEISVMPFDGESSVGRRMNELLADIAKDPVVHVIGGERVYSPGHTEHFLYLVLHAFKHFIHSGVGIRQLCDMVMYARAYGGGIDWEKVLLSLEELRARRWFATVMCICEERLGLDRLTDNVPDSVFAGAGDTALLLSDVLTGGIYGTADIKRLHSSGITLAAVESKDKSGRGALFGTLFPSPAAMGRRYGYLRSRPYLLPWAYVSRVAGYGVESIRSGRRASESYEIGMKRVELLSAYGIIDREK